MNKEKADVRTGIRQSYLTISVDDGHPTDLRVAELLARHELPATFYIPASNPERPILAKRDIRDLASHFEVGGHSYHHVSLINLSSQAAFREIVDGKTWLEDVSQTHVNMFCYPRGKFSKRLASIVRTSGFLGARTCLLNRIELPLDPFIWGVSTHAYSHSQPIQIRHALLEQNFRGLWNFFTVFNRSTDWVSHFMAGVRSVERLGGVAHLYLHGWEIDQRGEWRRLDALLSQLSNYPTLNRLSNGDFLSRIGSGRDAYLNADCQLADVTKG